MYVVRRLTNGSAYTSDWSSVGIRLQVNLLVTGSVCGLRAEKKTPTLQQNIRPTDDRTKLELKTTIDIKS